MAATPVNNTLPDAADIQGLILKGYTHPCSVHMLFTFRNARGVPAFFSALLPYLRSAASWGNSKPGMMLNIGLTAGGLQLARPDLSVSGVFPPTFVKGPESENAQLSLQDTGPGSPAGWWNGKFKTADIHCIVHAYAMDSALQAELVGIIAAAAEKTNGDVEELLPMNTKSGRLEEYPVKPVTFVHFGYKDSIDNPELNPAPAQPGQGDLANFLIGYAPDAIPGPTTGLEGAFAHNGCYNAFRVLHQDVPLFEKFLDDNAPEVAAKIGKPLPFAREWLAAKMNGRWRDGTPTVISPDAPDPASVEMPFEYDVNKAGLPYDTTGMKCPFSSHTRVNNPRNEEVKTVSSPSPRILRRGMPYGPTFDGSNAAEDRGLIGLFLCGSIATQFEKLYSWINRCDFSKVYPVRNPPQDALIANRPRPGDKSRMDNSLTIQWDNNGTPDKIVIKDLPQFVVTRGTAYFLLPSISSITDIANGK